MPISVINTRTFGVEVELFGIPAERAATTLRNIGLEARAEGYNHAVRPHWKITTDASIRDDRGVRNGIEMVSPILTGPVGLQNLMRACDALQAAGGQVNRTCGLHVHHDANDLDIDGWRALFKRYYKAELVLDVLMAPNRRGNENTYCQSIRVRTPSGNAQHHHTLTDSQIWRILDQARTIESMREQLWGTCACGTSQRCGCNIRYKKLNLGNYWRRGTLEFRHHTGTLNSTKIAAWVVLTQGMIQQAERANHEQMSMNHLSFPRFIEGVRLVGDVGLDVAAHYKRRWAQMQAAQSPEAAFRLAAA